MRRAAAFFALLFAFYLFLDLRLLKVERVQRALTARLERSFGRPVEVSNFELRLLDGPRLVANYVTVAEDPRFGYEPFLRAERVSAAVDLGALLSGRIEFASLRFTRPSFNLVRNLQGEWNINAWLGGGTAGGASPVPRLAAEHPRLSRISVQNGRINFKRDVEKLPFSLIGLEGSFERDGERWRLDFELAPMRSGATVQEAGTLRVRGSLSSLQRGLHPSELRLTWADASLADLFRLIYVRDVGVRAGLTLEVVARTDSRQDGSVVWLLQGKAALESVHSAEIPTRAGQPSLNLLLDASIQPAAATATINRLQAQMPQSEVRATGRVMWRGKPDLSVSLISPGVSFDDLFAWLRAFRPGVSDDAVASGNAAISAQIAGWPPRVVQGVLATDGAELRLAGEPNRLRLGRAALRWKNQTLELMPATLRLLPLSEPEAAPAVPQKSDIRVAGKGEATHGVPFTVTMAFATQAAEKLLPFAAAVAWPVTHGWMLEGGVAADVTWSGELMPFRASPRGKVEFRDARLQEGFLNQPVVLRDVRLAMDTAPGTDKPSWVSKLDVRKAEAFGAAWNGTAQRVGAAPWNFVLSAGTLDAADLDRWLNPRWRQTAIARSADRLRRAIGGAATAGARPLGFAAEGKIAVQELRMAPLTLRKVQGTLALEGSRLSLRGAQAELARGTARGDFAVRFSIPPEYTFDGTIERVNLAELAAASTAWRGRASGMAAGTLELAARGDNRSALAQTLAIAGELFIRDGDVRAVEIDAWAAGTPRPGRLAFREARGRFRLAESVVTLNPVEVRDAKQVWCIAGTVRVPDALDLTLSPRGAGLTGCPAARLPQAGEAARPLRGTLAEFSGLPAKER